MRSGMTPGCGRWSLTGGTSELLSDDTTQKHSELKKNIKTDYSMGRTPMGMTWILTDITQKTLHLDPYGWIDGSDEDWTLKNGSS